MPPKRLGLLLLSGVPSFDEQCADDVHVARCPFLQPSLQTIVFSTRPSPINVTMLLAVFRVNMVSLLCIKEASGVFNWERQSATCPFGADDFYRLS